MVDVDEVLVTAREVNQVALLEVTQPLQVATDGDGYLVTVTQTETVEIDGSAAAVLVVQELERVMVEVACGTIPRAGGCCLDDATVSAESTYSSEKIMELLYPFALLSFSLAPTTAEWGATVTEVSLNWSTNDTPKTIALNLGIGELPATTTHFTHSGQSITGNRTYTLTVTRNAITKTASATLAFLNRVYWGVHPTPTIDPEIITGWANQLSGNRSRLITFDCSGGRYFHVAYPARMGNASFKINNLTYSDVTQQTVNITNSQGYTEPYLVYHCTIIQFGEAITLAVS